MDAPRQITQTFLQIPEVGMISIRQDPNSEVAVALKALSKDDSISFKNIAVIENLDPQNTETRNIINVVNCNNETINRIKAYARTLPVINAGNP